MPPEFISEEQWSFLCARVSAVEAIALATARASPNLPQIRAQLLDDAESRKLLFKLHQCLKVGLKQPCNRLSVLLLPSNCDVESFTGVLKAHDIAISMDGRDRALDYIFVERLWRSVKYEDVYLKGYRNTMELMI